MAFQDEALAQSVMHALSQDRRIGGLPIMVHAANGEISLKGRVDYLEQKDLAAMVAKGIPGVRHVNTEELTVKEGGEAE